MNKEFFEKNYGKIMVFPIVLLIISLVFIGFQYTSSGDVVDRDVTLKGGVSATIYTDKEFDVDELTNRLAKELNSDVSVVELRNFLTNSVEKYSISAGEDKDDFESVLESVFGMELVEGGENPNLDINKMGSSLGENFYKDMFKAIIIAFILMGIVVFVAFRNFIPSLAVILSALLDISATLMIVNLLGIKVTIGGIAAFLLVIGYSVDTDILMTTKVLKRREGGSTIERLMDSAKTGLTMTTTTFIALSVGYIVSSSLVLKQMFLIINIALVVDVISTYAMNAGILYWYKEKKLKGNSE